MQQQSHHNTPFSATDIERYHNGQMSAQEMHLLEKAALEDPFLADALEGYLLTTTPAEDATYLHEKLQQRLQGKVATLPSQKPRFNLIAIAAMVVLIAAAAWFMYQLAGMGNKDIALQQTEKKEENTATDSNTLSDTQLPAESIATEKNTEVSANSTNNSISNKKGESIPEAEDVQLKQAPVLTQESDAAAGRSYDTIAFLQQPTAKNNVRQPAMRKSAVKAIHIFQGQVRDNGDNPLPNAVITDERNNVTTTSDSNGSFNLTTPDSTATVTVTFAGYEKEKRVLESATENKIFLKPISRTLNNKVEESKRTQTETVSQPSRVKIENAVPQNGWQQWEQYLSENFKTLWQQGVVVLSFDVNEKGKAVNINVDQSLCTACDAEAIRVLQEGPLWLQNNKTRAKATVQF